MLEPHCETSGYGACAPVINEIQLLNLKQFFCVSEASQQTIGCQTPYTAVMLSCIVRVRYGLGRLSVLMSIIVISLIILSPSEFTSIPTAEDPSSCDALP
jgi:hypothetical protein